MGISTGQVAPALRVSIAQGPGWVARFDGTVCILFGTHRHAAEFLRVVEAATVDAVDGTDVTRRVARWLVGSALMQDGEMPAGSGLGVMAVGAGGLSVIAAGDVAVQVCTGAGQEDLHGRQVATWIDRIVGAISGPSRSPDPVGTSMSTPPPVWTVGW